MSGFFPSRTISLYMARLFLVRTFGLPPEGEPEAVVEAVVDELVRRGVVERAPQGSADPR